MTERSLIFPVQEFRDRIARLQEQMAQRGEDALLLSTPADIFYTTGFLTRFWESPARPWWVIVPAKGAPVAVIPAIGAALMAQTWIRNTVTWDAPDPQDDGVSLLAQTLCELTPQNGRIAVPMGLETHVRMPMADYQKVTQAVQPRQIVDGTDTIQRVREIKSPAEIAKIRASCAIADRAFADVAEFAQHGTPLAQVFRDFQIALLRHGADWVSYVAGGAGRGGYVDVISPATAMPLQKGDVLMLDTGAVKDGYFCDFDRNVAIGPISAEVAQVHAALWDATEDALAQLRPGMLACDAHRILSDGLIKRGARPGGGRLGHGLGVTLTEWPSFTPRDQTPLRAGMVLTLEPGAMVGTDKMLVHEENIVLTETGPTLLSTRAPREMQRIG